MTTLVVTVYDFIEYWCCDNQHFSRLNGWYVSKEYLKNHVVYSHIISKSGHGSVKRIKQPMPHEFCSYKKWPPRESRYKSRAFWNPLPKDPDGMTLVISVWCNCNDWPHVTRSVRHWNKAEALTIWLNVPRIWPFIWPVLSDGAILTRRPLILLQLWWCSLDPRCLMSERSFLNFR